MTEYTLLLTDHDKRGTGFDLISDDTDVPERTAPNQWKFHSTLPEEYLTAFLGRLAVWIASYKAAGYSVDIASVVDGWIGLVTGEGSDVLTDKPATTTEVMQ